MSGLFQDDPPRDTPPPPSDVEDSARDAPPPPEGPGLFGESLPAAAEPEHAVAYRVLARKYRPATFDDLIGQEAMVRILRNAFATNRVAHAFMLTGVRGVGKTTTARIIARALNCVGPDGTGGPTADPCGVCENCTAILADRHPDVIEMDAASRNGVNDVREIIEAVRFRPMQARNKVFILDEVHMLTTQAFNALLKTLEEPPPHVKFIFATTELRKVPITVLSRCQRFDLRRVRVTELTAHYGRIARKENVAIEPDALAQIARAADGSVRDGLSILDQAIAQRDMGAEGGITAAQVSDMLGLADREAVFDLMDAVLAGKPAAALAITDAAFERGADLGVMLQDLLDLTHTLTRLKSVPSLRESQDLPEAERTRGVAMVDRLTVPVLARAWQMLLKGVGEVEIAPDRKAAAEMVLIRLCHVADTPTPGDLVRRLTTGVPAMGGPTGGTPTGGTPAGGTPTGRAPTGGAPAAAPGIAVSRTAPFGTAPVGTAAPGTAALGTAALATAPAPPGGGGIGGSARAVAGGGVMAVGRPDAVADAASAPATFRLGTFREVVAFVAQRREPMLHSHLLHSVHLVRFAPPVIELRPQPVAPRTLSADLARLLTEATGTRWTIAVSLAQGEPTLAEQGAAADTARRSAAADHPMVRAILDAFPGARIETVHDRNADAYGLPVGAPIAGGDADGIAGFGDDPDIPPFAPPDAEYFDDDPMETDS